MQDLVHQAPGNETTWPCGRRPKPARLSASRMSPLVAFRSTRSITSGEGPSRAAAVLTKDPRPGDGHHKANRPRWTPWYQLLKRTFEVDGSRLVARDPGALRPENGAQSGGDAPGDPERARRADGSEPWAPGPYAAFTLEPRGASLVGRGVPRGHIRLSFALAE